MKTFNEFLIEVADKKEADKKEDTWKEDDKGRGKIVKAVRKAIGPGKTQQERGSHWLHAGDDQTHESLTTKVGKALGTTHTTDKFGRAVWKTGLHTVMMHQHGDGHKFFEVSET